MTREEAEGLSAMLFAAFPFPRPPDATTALYVEMLLEFEFEPALATVQLLVRGEERLPPIAVLLREYRAARRRRAVENAEIRGLPEPPVDPENAAKARELLERLRRSTKDLESPNEAA